MTTTLTTPNTSTTPAVAPRTVSSKQLWRTGAVAGLSAAVATTGVAAIASALDGSLEVSGEAIPVVGFAQLTLVGALIGTVLAVVFARRADRPRHTFVMTTVALTALSIVPDGFADAQTSTRVVLALTHVVAAAIVIPALASRLAD